MKKRVLFLCTGNSARSQMAEGLLRYLAGKSFDAFSAGTNPVGLHSGAVAAMKDIGIDITAQHSKHVSQFAGNRFDYVITVCDRAKESCPIWPGATVLLHWSFEDPAAVQGTEAERQQAFSLVRDEIAIYIQNFTSEAAAPTRRTDVTV
jgi:arsenate reductase (thioredoxin)